MLRSYTKCSTSTASSRSNASSAPSATRPSRASTSRSSYIPIRLEELCLLNRDIDRFWNEIVFLDVGDGRHEDDDWSEGNYGNYDDDDDDDLSYDSESSDGEDTAGFYNSPAYITSLRLNPQSTAHFYRFHTRSSDGRRVPNDDGELWFVQHHEWIREVWELKLELVRSLLKEDRRPCGSQFRHVVQEDWEESPVTIFVRQVLGMVEEVVERWNGGAGDKDTEGANQVGSLREV
jgi:hypothetical protein